MCISYKAPVYGLLHPEAQGEELVLVEYGGDVLGHTGAHRADPGDNALVALQEGDGLLGARQHAVGPGLTCGTCVRASRGRREEGLLTCKDHLHILHLNDLHASLPCPWETHI